MDAGSNLQADLESQKELGYEESLGFSWAREMLCLLSYFSALNQSCKMAVNHGIDMSLLQVSSGTDRSYSHVCLWFWWSLIQTFCFFFKDSGVVVGWPPNSCQGGQYELAQGLQTTISTNSIKRALSHCRVTFGGQGQEMSLSLGDMWCWFHVYQGAWRLWLPCLEFALISFCPTHPISPVLLAKDPTLIQKLSSLCYVGFFQVIWFPHTVQRNAVRLNDVSNSSIVCRYMQWTSPACTPCCLELAPGPRRLQDKIRLQDKWSEDGWINFVSLFNGNGTM